MVESMAEQEQDGFINNDCDGDSFLSTHWRNDIDLAYQKHSSDSLMSLLETHLSAPTHDMEHDMVHRFCTIAVCTSKWFMDLCWHGLAISTTSTRMPDLPATCQWLME